jgi:TonB family protein
MAVIVACVSNPANNKRPASKVLGSFGCLDTLRASDSLWRVVKLSVLPQDTSRTLPRDFESFFAQEFRHKLKVPAHIQLGVVMGTQPCDSAGLSCSGGRLDLGAIAFATAHVDGKLSGIDVVDATLTPTLADSVRSALAAMSREALAPPSADDSISVMIRLETDENPDTVPELRHVFRARVPHYALPFRYASMPAEGVEAKYPFAARLAGVGDSVRIAFTVDAEGRVATESLELVRASYRDFIASAVDALQRTRYHPARLGDCPVSTRMSQRFLFSPAGE